MRRGLAARLERLESRVVTADCGLKIRFGDLKRLPPEYEGERHVIVARHLPNRGDQEWVEFEEVSGPDPAPPSGPGRPIAGRLDVMFVEAYPWQEETVDIMGGPRR